MESRNLFICYKQATKKSQIKGEKKMAENIVNKGFETEEGNLTTSKLSPAEAAFMIIGANIGSGIL